MNGAERDTVVGSGSLVTLDPGATKREIARSFFPVRPVGTSTVCNLAARLCTEAKDGQILVSSRIAEAVETVARLEDEGNLELKGLRRPVAAFNVVQSASAAEARPNLTVVARGPGA
jgi:hypothetical protein